MCKFESRRSPGYTAVVANLKRFSHDAPAKIAANWAQEGALQEQKRRQQAMDLLSTSEPPLTGVLSTPLGRSIDVHVHQPRYSRINSTRPVFGPARKAPRLEEPSLVVGCRPFPLSVTSSASQVSSWRKMKSEPMPTRNDVRRVHDRARCFLWRISLGFFPLNVCYMRA